MRLATRVCETVVLLLLLSAVWGCQSPAGGPGTEGNAAETAPPKDDHADEKPGESEAHGELITLSPQARQAAGITLESVVPRSLRRELRLSGTIQANENRVAHVGPRIQGRVVELSAALGARVKAGEKLAVIDSPELGQAQSDFLTARAKLLVAEKAYERAKTLLDGKVIGKGEFQRREGEFMAGQAEAQAAEDRLRLLGMDEADITNLGELRAVRSRVAMTAPLAGTVIGRHATMGEVVEPAKTLFIIADLSALWGMADIPERDLPAVRTGLDATVTAAAYSHEVFPGKVTYISDTLDPSTRTAKVRVEIGNAHAKLKPEMFATFTILAEETESVVSVSERAVQRDGGKTIVFVAEGEGFEKRPVELGPKLQGYYPVRSGLQPGEQVVTQGAFVLKSESERGQMEEGHGH